MKLFSTSSSLLKNQTALFERVHQKKVGFHALLELLGMSVIGLSIFGAVMSLSIPHWWHALTLMWKMNVLIFGSVLLCVPALFVFSSIRGSRVALMQLLILVVGSIATIAFVVLALAPIAWFFTWTTNDVAFVRVMNAAMIGLGLLFGLVFIARGMLALHRQYKLQYPEHKAAIDILFIWLILVSVVTIQMGNKLGPWYHIEQPNEICLGVDFCFPRAPQGIFLEQPTMTSVQADGTPVLVWSLPKSYCEVNAVDYAASGGIHSFPAECEQTDTDYRCRSVITDIKNIPNVKLYRFQAHHRHCTTYNSNVQPDEYISDVIDFTKP